MKKVLMFSILGITICLMRRMSYQKRWTEEPPTFTTVGQEYSPPPETASKEEKAEHFDNWCKHTGVSSKWIPPNKMEYAKESTVIQLKHD